ncbi:SPFH domain-containing protein [Vallitalea okinawensis]|uniref:SPFH domain-containing protein n=1 Tax=Vallitalea okinawensis TaxID=2078660 RepID=UPI000CFB4A8B|nr:SPFH domain-containing protein [Vallitalea okinawensis]
MKKGIIFGSIIIAVVILFNMFTFIVREDEVAVIRKLGKIDKVIVNTSDYEIVEENLSNNDLSSVELSQQKGLNFKIPILNTVEKYTSKYLTYKSLEENINTKDDRQILIQMYAQYRIVDPAVFNITLRSKSNVHTIMDDRVYSAIVNSVNSLNFEEFFEKEKITDLLDSQKDQLNESLIRDYGIMAVDIGINRKNFPVDNITSIESKMSKQIEKESEKLIAEGDAEYQKRNATTDRQKAEIVAVAIEDSARIRAEADAEAIRIYQESLQKDLEFYQFIKRMELYQDLSGSTIFMDSSESVFDYLNNSGIEELAE